MDLETARADAVVATAAAGGAIGVTLLLTYGFGVDASALVRIAPLSVYGLYVFTHTRLPEGADRPRNWVGVAVLVALASVGYALAAAA